MIRRLLVTVPPTVFAAVAVKKDNSQASSSVNETYVCKPTELPVYQPLHAFNEKKSTHPPRDSAIYKNIESGVRVVRIEVQKGMDIISEQLNTLEEYWDTAKAHTQMSIDYLNEPQNTIPRGGAIAIGGLAGFIFATRGGFIKKVFYTSAGAGAIAALCYPRKAEEFAQDALYEARRAFSIGYNFVKGVKPGDEVSIEPINKFPTSLNDIKIMMYDIYDEAKETILSKKK